MKIRSFDWGCEIVFVCRTDCFNRVEVSCVSGTAQNRSLNSTSRKFLQEILSGLKIVPQYKLHVCTSLVMVFSGLFWQAKYLPSRAEWVAAFPKSNSRPSTTCTCILSAVKLASKAMWTFSSLGRQKQVEKKFRIIAKNISCAFSVMKWFWHVTLEVSWFSQVLALQFSAVQVHVYVFIGRASSPSRYSTN